eukprot:12945809-Heterocapsa_arctica.AAC.1
MLKTTFESDYRAIGATLGWGRKRTLHIFSIYGFDTGQAYQQGQSYYERGGDWDMAPGTCVIEGMNNSAAYLDPAASTCCSGNTSLDWFM